MSGKLDKSRIGEIGIVFLSFYVLNNVMTIYGVRTSYSLVSVVLMAYLSIVIHEMGHIISARMMGMPILKVVLGTGSTLLKIGDLEINLIPFSGYIKTRIYTSKGLKSRVFLLMAGSLGQMIMAAIILSLNGHWMFSAYANGFAVWNLTVALMNLLPLFEGSDGMLIKSLINKKRSLTPLMVVEN